MRVELSKADDGVESLDFAAEFMKAERTSDHERLIRGLASAEEPDLQDEVIVQKGIDFGYLLAKGSINWDHHEDPEIR